MLVVDGHAHCWPQLGTAAGWSSKEEYLRHLQSHMTTHQMGARRVRDNVRVTEPTLWDGKTLGLTGLLDVDFRVGRFGRFEWEKDGEAYYIQFLPPTLEDMTARPERLLAQMQFLGVQKALLQSGRLYGLTNEYLAGVVRQWPDKLRACAQIDEDRADTEEQLHTLHHAAKNLGLKVLYYANDGFALNGYRNHFDDEKYLPFWEAVEALGLVVVWDIRFARRRTQADYMIEALRLQRHMKRFPKIQNVLSHGMPLNSFEPGGRLPDELLDVLGEPNLMVELIFPLLHGSYWDYPYVEAQPIIRQLIDRLGPTKLLWGSDLPNVERSCTYAQSLEYLRKYCTFLKESDLDLILGQNALRLYFS